MALRKAAVWALAVGLASLATPVWADTLIDNVRGINFDAEGHVERFTGFTITNDGHVGQILRAYDLRPTKIDYALDGKGAVVIPGLVIGHMHLMDSALELITPPQAAGRALPPPRPEDRDLALGMIQPQLLARGITAVADMGTSIEDWQSYRRAGDSGRLSLRIIGYAAGVANMALIGGPGPTPWLYGSRLRLVGLYIDANAAKAEKPNPIQLKNMMSRAALDHFQVAVRLEPVAGDGAVPERLDELTKAISELGETYKGDRRWRVDGVPAHLPLPEPLAQLPEAARPVALAGFSASAAQKMFAEGQFGRLAPGLWADFVMLNGDPLAVNGPAPKVVQTWVAGRKLFTAGENGPARAP